MKELKPCPYCGGRNLFIGDSNELDVNFNDTQYAVCCDYSKGGCGAVSGFRMTEDEAVDAWNRRA